MAPGTAQEKTMEAMMKVDSIVAAHPAVRTRSQIVGYSFLSGQGSAFGTIIARLKDWSVRGEGEDVNSVIATLTAQLNSAVKDARIMLFGPPMIPGYSAMSGFTLNIDDAGRAITAHLLCRTLPIPAPDAGYG